MVDSEAEEAVLGAQAMESDPEIPGDVEETAADDFDEEDEYDPSRTFDDQYQNSEQGYQQTDEPTEEQQEQLHEPYEADRQELQSELTAPNPTTSSDLDNGIASDALDPAQNLSHAESQTSTPARPTGISAQPQTRTISGFDVEDDEDEDELDNEEADYEPPAVLGVDDSNAMPMTMSEDPISENQNHTTSPDVPSHLQPSASVLDVANSSYSPAPASNIDPSVSASLQWAQNPSMQNSTIPTPVPDSPSGWKGRMAHDRVGILQDRVDEDPRGDIPAWLELIAEHRARSRLDSAREVYERFLKEFPVAVSLRPAFPDRNQLTLAR